MKSGVTALVARLDVIRYISDSSALDRLRYVLPPGCVTEEHAATPGGTFSNVFSPGIDKVLSANIVGRF